MTDHLTRAAAAIADWPDLWSTLAARHVPGADGRCSACPSPVRVAPRWPCRIADLARVAEELYVENPQVETSQVETSQAVPAAAARGGWTALPQRPPARPSGRPLRLCRPQTPREAGSGGGGRR